MSDDMPLYPKGSIAMLNGDLQDVVNVKIVQKNGGKIIHTMRVPSAGVFIGNHETDVTFEAVVSQNGPERDYFADIKAGKIRKLRIKIPGETFSVIGMATERSLELPLDDAIKYSINFIGRTEN